MYIFKQNQEVDDIFSGNSKNNKHFEKMENLGKYAFIVGLENKEFSAQNIGNLTCGIFFSRPVKFV